MFTMFYAERIGDTSKGEPYIAERGVFYSIEEFAPYREAGWEGTQETNAAADAYLAERAIRCHADGHVWVGIGEEGRVVCDDCGIDKPDVCANSYRAT